MIAVALILLFTGPWLVYLLVPVPDQLAEYRNYSMVAGFALLASLTPDWLWVPLMAYFCAMSHHHAMAYTDQIAFWKYANTHTSGDRSRSFQEIGAFLKISGKNEEAEPYFVKALNLNPKLAPAMENLANIYLLTDRPAWGLSLITELTETCPDYASGWQMLGLLHEQKGELFEAIGCYDRAVNLQDMPQSANHLGLIAFRQQRFNDAVRWFQKAATSHPGEPTFQYNEAMALYGAGRKEEGDVIRMRFNGIPLQWNPEMVPQPPQQQQSKELLPV